VSQRVDVVRVKNRNELLPATPPTPSPPGGLPPAPRQPATPESWELKQASVGLGSGYRDVAVNLRVVAGAGMAPGLSGHICEVQLLLEGFARVKSDDGHRLYVEWRNFRGE
jgi:hypothetical protein